MQPTAKPKNPNFSSGPCSKRPGYDVNALQLNTLGRSHRSALGKKALGLACSETARILGLPEGYRVGVVPGSDTGAVEMAMWSLLGQRGVDVLAWESFGSGWATDVVKQLKLANARVLKADYGQIVDLSQVNFDNDVVFTWNGTTSGVKVPNGDWIPDDRAGLTICDATSAVFAMESAVEQTGRRDLLVAEGAGRRRGTRHADPRPARRCPPRELQPAMAVAQGVPADLRRQAQ
jgi:phosphoserine aminotransferase